MTNREWLESKTEELRDKYKKGCEKLADWIVKHIWFPIIFSAIVVVSSIICGFLINEVFFILFIGNLIFGLIFVCIAIEEWLDEEHKEKKTKCKS